MTGGPGGPGRSGVLDSGRTGLLCTRGMKHTVPHGLEPELARKTAERALESYAEDFRDFRPTVIWSRSDRADVSFAARGMVVEGFLEVGAQAYLLYLKVPFLLRMFEKRAVEVIENEIKTWVARAKNGDLAEPR